MNTHTHTDTKSNLLNSHQLNISVKINFKIRKGSTGSACTFPFIVAVMQSFFSLDALVQVAWASNSGFSFYFFLAGSLELWACN